MIGATATAEKKKPCAIATNTPEYPNQRTFSRLTAVTSRRKRGQRSEQVTLNVARDECGAARLRAGLGRRALESGGAGCSRGAGALILRDERAGQHHPGTKHLQDAAGLTQNDDRERKRDNDLELD